MNKVQLSGFQCYDCSELNQTKDELKVASIAGANELVVSHTNKHRLRIQPVTVSTEQPLTSTPPTPSPGVGPLPEPNTQQRGQQLRTQPVAYQKLTIAYILYRFVLF